MGKTVLVTGTSSGIGKATAALFAKNSWNVIATMRTPDAQSDLVGNPSIFLTRLNVQERASISQAITAGISRFGTIDLLINNAGFGLFGLFEAVPREKVIEQLDVNLLGVMDVTRAILPHFRQNHAGMIINMTSRAGLIGLPMNSLYCASKFALEGFSEALSYELASQNILVKIVEPSGGTSGTNFSKRMAQEYSQDTAPPEYTDFVTHTSATFAAMRSARMATSEDVAKVIFTAATDGSRQLRYIAGSDTPPFIKARREMSDLQYTAFMRAQFHAPDGFTH